MSKYILPPEELENVRKQAEQARCESGVRLRLLCIYWAGCGKSMEEIHEMLFLPERTIYLYLKEYAERKKIRDDDSNPGGRPRKLCEEQEEDLKKHLERNVYESTIAIVTYIKKKYGVSFSRGGLAKWLRTRDFRYKRPKRVPYTVDVEKQEAFINTYHEMKSNLKDHEVILFMDGVHPDHQTQNVHGWIKRCVSAQVPSTGKQKRLHYMGAVLVHEDRVEHVIKEYKKINSEAVQDFLGALSDQYCGKKLKIICDRGAYHTSKETRQFVQDQGNIDLIYLPPRCPNLNLIERLWKILRENVTYNKYYERFSDFREAVEDFFRHKIVHLQPILRTRLRDNFHIIQPVFLQTVR
jgi:transposase